jgi:hypothetical protein
MSGVGGAAVSGRLWLAGTEARPTELFSYKVAFKQVIFSITKASAWDRTGETPVPPNITFLTATWY